MTDQPKGNSLRSQVLLRMQEKETDELIDIWRKNDRDAWSAEALEVVEQILIQRLGKLPEMISPSTETDDEETEEKVVEYPTDKKLIWIAELSSRLAPVVLPVAGIYAGLHLIYYFFVLHSPSEWLTVDVLWGGLIRIVGQIEGLIVAGVTFLVLQAIAEIIYLLMDIRDFVQPEETEIEAV